jgi:dGTPase
MLSLRTFMFETVYLGASNVVQNDRAGEIVRRIFVALIAEPDRLPDGEGDEADRITDFVAGMTDRYALAYVQGL